MILSGLGNYKHTGLFILRLGIGIMFMLHGYPKLTGGPEMWEKLGSASSHVGINFYPVFWGFMAAAAEFFGGALMILGFAFRPACIFLFFTMLVAAVTHISKGDGIMGASHAIELGIVFLGLLILGPGKYSIDKK